MFRRMLLALAVILVLAIPARARQTGTPDWTAWLYESASGRFTLVDSDGASREFTLPLAEAFNAYEPGIAVAPSGSHVAYIARDSLAETPNRQLFVYDVALQSLAASYPISPTTDETSLGFDDPWGPAFGSGAAMFNEAASRLAVGSVFLGPEYGWEIAVIDYRLGNVVATLHSEDEAAAQLPSSMLPVIGRYAGDEVTFLSVYWNTEAFYSYPAFTWNTETGEITPDEVFWSLSDDTLAATGEVVGRLYDERLPAALSPEEAIGDFGPRTHNVLRAYDPTAGMTHVFYNDSRADIRNAVFIQNGERILVYSVDDVSAEHRWTVVERDGTAIAERPFSEVRPRAFGTPDGFVYLESSGTPALIHVSTRIGAFEAEIVWEAQTTTPLALVHLVQSAAPPVSYTPWADIVEPTGE